MGTTSRPSSCLSEARHVCLRLHCAHGDQDVGTATGYWTLTARHYRGQGQAPVDHTFTLPPRGLDEADGLLHVEDDHREAESIQIIVDSPDGWTDAGTLAYRTLEFRSLALVWNPSHKRSGF